MEPVTMLGLATMAAGAGGLSSYFGSKGKKSRWEIDPYGAFTPEQRRMHQMFGPLISDRARNLSLYGKPMTAEYTAGEQANLERYRRLSALGEEGLSNLMRGEFPEEYFTQSVYNPMRKRFEEDIKPLIEEQYAGPGGYWGSARAGAVGKGYRDLIDTLASERVRLAHQARQMPLYAAPVAAGMAETGAQLEAVPRLVEGLGLQRQYADWVRGREDMKSYVDKALSFMDISGGTALYQPAETKWYHKALSDLFGMGSTYVGGKIPMGGTT